MGTSHNHPTRSQRIFNLGLSVESVSLYLLCCGLTDEGKTPALKEIKRIWNSSEESLETAILDLEKRNILRKIISDDTGNVLFKVLEDAKWHGL